MKSHALIRKLQGEIVVTVKLSRGFRVRLTVGLWLLRLGARVLSGAIPTRIETTGGEDGAPEVGV